MEANGARWPSRSSKSVAPRSAGGLGSTPRRFRHFNRFDTTLLYSSSLLILTHNAFYKTEAVMRWALRGRFIMNIGVHNFDLSTEESGDAS